MRQNLGRIVNEEQEDLAGATAEERWAALTHIGDAPRPLADFAPDGGDGAGAGGAGAGAGKQQESGGGGGGSGHDEMDDDELLALQAEDAWVRAGAAGAWAPPAPGWRRLLALAAGPAPHAAAPRTSPP